MFLCRVTPKSRLFLDVMICSCIYWLDIILKCKQNQRQKYQLCQTQMVLGWTCTNIIWMEKIDYVNVTLFTVESHLSINYPHLKLKKPCPICKKPITCQFFVTVFGNDEFTWPLQRLLVTSNHRGKKLTTWITWQTFAFSNPAILAKLFRPFRNSVWDSLRRPGGPFGKKFQQKNPTQTT